MTPQGGHYHPHYTLEECEAGKLGDLSKVGRLGSSILRCACLPLPSNIFAPSPIPWGELRGRRGLWVPDSSWETGRTGAGGICHS